MFLVVVDISSVAFYTPAGLLEGLVVPQDGSTLLGWFVIEGRQIVKKVVLS